MPRQILPLSSRIIRTPLLNFPVSKLIATNEAACFCSFLRSACTCLVRLLALQLEDIDQFRFEIAAGLADFIDRDHVACDPVSRETKAYELFEILDSRGATDLVVVTVEGEANCEVPASPETTDHCACESGENRGEETDGSGPVEENRRPIKDTINDPRE